MESRLGFKPVTQGKRYFISYKRDSSELIRGITHCLDEMGVPMWCDEGIPMDSHWKGIISQNINDCDAMIFFATRDVFSEDSYLRIEYETASRKNIRIYVIKLYPFAESDINVVLETWYTEVMQKQILDIADKHWDDDEIAWDIVKKCNLHFEPQKLLECAFSYLEKEKYAIADKYCDRVLEKDSENGWAYLVKLMSELQVSSMEALGDVDNPLESSAYYQKAVQLLKNEEPSVLLQKYNAQIKADNELKRKTAIYERAKNALEKACSEDDCNAAAKMFRSIAGFKDSDEWVKQSEDKADFARKVVDNERKALGETYLKEEHGVENPQEKNPSGDNNEDNKLDKRDLSDNRGIGKRPIIVIKKLIMCCISIGFIAMILYLAVSFKTEFEIMNAIEYNDAISSIKEGDYKKAIRLLKGLDYGDSTWVRLAISDVRHQQELAKIGEGSYYVFGSYEQDNDESNGKEDIEWLVLAKEDNRITLLLGNHDFHYVCGISSEKYSGFQSGKMFEF